MKDLYLYFLDQWNKMGGDLMSMFVLCSQTSKWSSWGLLEYQNQSWEDAPKWLAVLEYLGIVTGVENAEELMPGEYRLFQNYPNPFNPTTVISYYLPRNEKVTLKIYNILGEEIKTLINVVQVSGNHAIEWDGTNEFGLKVANGLYIYRLQAGDFIKSVKMVLIK